MVLKVRVTAAAAAFLLVLGLPLTGHAASDPSRTHPTKSAPARTGSVTFGIQAASGHRGDDRPDFQFGGGAGSAPFHDTVSVLNIGNVPLHLTLYPADSQGTSNGQFAVKLQHARQDDVGAWIKLARGPSVTVPARTALGASRIFVPFSLGIPRNATPGDHVGAIMVSLRTTASSKGRADENLDHRVGIRVYVRVSGTVRAGLSVTALHSTFGPQFQANPLGIGHVSVTYLVRNTGNVILGANQRVIVAGLLGTKHKAVMPLVPALLPGDSVQEHTVVTSVFPEFTEKTTVTLQPLAPVGADDTALHPVSESHITWAVPWELIAIVVLALLAAVGYLRRRRASTGAHSSVGRSS